MLVQAILDSAQPAGGSRSDVLRRRRTSRLLFRDHPVATAVVRVSSSSADVNHPWSVLFDATNLVPDAVRAIVASARSRRSPHHIPQLEVTLGGRTRFVALTVALLEPPGPEGAWIVSCTEVTDAVIAARLGADPSTIVWGGRTDGPEAYFSRSWNETVAARGDGESWRDAVHPEDLARCLDAFGAAARRRESSRVEVRLRSARDGYRWFVASFICETDGWWYGKADRASDADTGESRAELVARARAAREDAEQATRLKDEFLAIVSHELRAPLTTMMLWQHVLRDESAPAASRQRALQAIHESINAQNRFVGDLLDISRAISGKLSIDPRRIDLSLLVRDVIDGSTPVAIAGGVQLSCTGCHPETDIEIDGDVVRLRQVFDNLLSNAIKFTPRHGTVAVTIAMRGTDVEIAIRDSGRGIAPEFMTRIFQPFSQSEDSLTGRHGGLGLGLAISQRLVALHGGTLHVQSGGSGLGTTAVVTLPNARVRTASSSPKHEAGALLDGVRVLVVEDEPRVSEALHLLLGGAGASVTCAASAADARAALVDVTADIMVCDIAMAGEDGYTFIRSLRDRGVATPAVALTAFATERDAERALDAGFDVHLAKPINIERLIAVLADLHRSAAAIRTA